MPKNKKTSPDPKEESASESIMVVKEEIETIVAEVSPQNLSKPPVEKKEASSFTKEELKEDEKAPFYKTLFWMIVPVILLMTSVATGFFIFQLGVARGIQMQKEVTPTPTPTSTPTPAPTLKRENLKIQVLNGAGIAGTASSAKEFLEELGYEGVDTGNADSFDFEKSEIAIKEGKENYLKLLSDDLAREYVVSEDTKTLDADSEHDAVIIIGETKKE